MISHISKLLKNPSYKRKKWIILGKGPSFSEINNIDLSEYNVFSLNSTISQLKDVDIAHMIDFDVFTKHQDDFYNNAKNILMPINPHFDNKPSKTTIYDLLRQNDVLKKLAKEKRLFWYNHLSKKSFLTLKNFKKILYKKHNVRHFSAEAAFVILGSYNFREIYSAGIDGGNSYNNKFSKETLLQNKKESFNDQFSNIIRSIKKYHIIYSPLNSDYPINVYVRSQEEQMLSFKVLEYSIKKRTPVEVNVFAMHKSDIKYPIAKDPNNRQRTPFSFQRFLIPQLNEFKGKAIYLDSDMQVFSDIRQLYNLPMSDCDLLTVENEKKSRGDIQFSVMLLDCEKLQWSINDMVDMIDKGQMNYQALMKEMKVAKNIGVKIPYYWNCLEWFKKGQSALVHYTDMQTQPWVYANNKNGSIWMKDLIAAIDEGFIDIDYVKDHIKKGWVRPSLLYQIENRIFDGREISDRLIEDLDGGFRVS